MDKKYLVIENGPKHSGYVAEVDIDNIWQANFNEDGWTYQQIAGNGNVAGEYDTEEEAQEHLDAFLECDAPETGKYCYTHNPDGN
jgi:hypothetical protein